MEVKKVKRSQINSMIESSFEFLEKMNFKLPKWYKWNAEEWRSNAESATEIFDNKLGWDVTDLGSGDLEKRGQVLFTIRNGSYLPCCTKNYCEKIIIIENEQFCPFHYHKIKTEDIINRGGDNLVMQFYKARDDDEFSDEDITISIDGIKRVIKAGEKVVLEPGESVCIEPFVYHSFWSENRNKILVHEVSKVNDDSTDNFFYDKTIGRFPTVDEDEEIKYFLVNDYYLVK